MQWTVKYAPRSSQDLIGNKNNYNKLIAWLKTFYMTNKEDNKKFKPITLLIGSPGIGKTSGIVAIANDLNYEIIEFNASDQRNANVIKSLVGRASKTKHNPGFKGRVVLLDEVDGIHGNEDRGGLASLLKLAKESFHPIICTANDPNSPKMRSFKRSVSVDMLTFKKPNNNEVVSLLQKIVNNEGITVSPKVLNVIANNSKGDIRGSINDLENLAQDRKQIPVTAIQALSIRDTDTSIDLALSQIFGESKTLRQAHDMTSDLDVDYSMFMNYVIENISQHAGNSTEFKDMYENSALANLFYSRIIFTQNWKFLKYCFYFLSAGIRGSKKTAYIKAYPKFPSLLMDLSRTKKVRDIRDSVNGKIGYLTHSSKNKTSLGTLPFVRIIFEELFNLYSKKQIDSEKGNDLLNNVAEIHNEVEFLDEELLFLFNDPLYEKPTPATEKKQKLLIKIIQETATEIRIKHINEFSSHLDGKIKNSFLDQIKSSDGIVKDLDPKINDKEEKFKDFDHTKTIKPLKKSKKAQSRSKKFKSSNLLEFTDKSESSKKSKKKKASKSLNDFV